MSLNGIILYGPTMSLPEGIGMEIALQIIVTEVPKVSKTTEAINVTFVYTIHLHRTLLLNTLHPLTAGDRETI